MLSSVLLQVPQAQTHSLILTYLDHLMAEQIHCQVDDSPEPHADCPHMRQKGEEEGGTSIKLGWAALIH